MFLAPPAHTDGDTFVHFPESDVLHLGDVFRTTSYPIIDVYNGGTLAGTIEALDLATSLAGPKTKVIPGHGVEVVGRQELVQFRDMIVDISNRVHDLIADGKTVRVEYIGTTLPAGDYAEDLPDVGFCPDE